MTMNLPRLQLLVLERRNRTLNMDRFYVLSIEPSLFGGAVCRREWGRIGTTGRSFLELHPDEASAREALTRWFARKRRRGYVLTLSHVDIDPPCRSAREASPSD